MQKPPLVSQYERHPAKSSAKDNDEMSQSNLASEAPKEQNDYADLDLD